MDKHLVFEAVEARAELPGFSEMEKVGFAWGFGKEVFSAGFRSFFRFFFVYLQNFGGQGITPFQLPRSYLRSNNQSNLRFIM